MVGHVMIVRFLYKFKQNPAIPEKFHWQITRTRDFTSDQLRDQMVYNDWADRYRYIPQWILLVNPC